MHILAGPHIGHKGDDAPVFVIGKGQAGFLFGLPQDTFFGAFPLLELAADADPLVLVLILLLFDPMEHKITALVFDIAKGGLLAHKTASLSLEKL